ncbi:MAG: stage III sporulation protein AF [Defluviitaleaceae bacterium]|nr:stage III sporulation protein AF [Defluviitaleaceae bacterium]
MPVFFIYLRHITYYLMFATVVGMFAPPGKYRKMISLVLGLVLILLLVRPLVSVLSEEVPVTDWFGAARLEGANNDAFYAAWWDEHFASAFQTQLEMQLSRLLSANNFTMHSAQFEYSECFGAITGVRVSVARARNQNESVPFIRIQPPQISPVQIGPAPEPPSCPDSDAVKTLISQFYNLPASHIHVEIL